MNSVKIEQKFKEIFTDCKVNKIIFIGDAFNSDEEQAASHILMIPDMESLEKIMTNLGIDL